MNGKNAASRVTSSHQGIKVITHVCNKHASKNEFKTIFTLFSHLKGNLKKSINLILIVGYRM